MHGWGADMYWSGHYLIKLSQPAAAIEADSPAEK